MNQKPKPTDILQEIYKYFCASVQHDKSVFYPKNIVHIEGCFQQLAKYIDEQEKPIKIDGYVGPAKKEQFKK